MDSKFEATAFFLHTDRPFTASAFAMRNYFLELAPESTFARLIDGDLRQKFVYPRIQFTVIKQEPVVVAINEAIEVVRDFVNRVRYISVSFINWSVEQVDEQSSSAIFTKADSIYNYELLNPWVALTEHHFTKYKYFYGSERVGYLNKILTKNILFLIREFSEYADFKVTCRVRMNGLKPMIDEQLQAGLFTGDFQTNVRLPDYIGMGSAISRGYGTIRLINSFRRKAPKGPDMEVNGNLITTPLQPYQPK
jgi:hypothetical protein